MTQSATAQAWPFLVGRGRDAGYQVITAPDFLIASGEIALLEAEELLHDGGDTPMTAVVQAATGTLSATFMSERVTAPATVSAEDEPVEPWLDRHGRPLRITYGFVCAADAAATVAPDLQRCRIQALEAYRGFLDHGEPIDPQATSAFHLTTTQPKVAADRDDDDHEPRGNKRLLWLLGGLAAAVVVALWVILRSLGGAAELATAVLTPAAEAPFEQPLLTSEFPVPAQDERVAVTEAPANWPAVIGVPPDLDTSQGFFVHGPAPGGGQKLSATFVYTTTQDNSFPADVIARLEANGFEVESEAPIDADLAVVLRRGGEAVSIRHSAAETVVTITAP